MTEEKMTKLEELDKYCEMHNFLYWVLYPIEMHQLQREIKDAIRERDHKIAELKAEIRELRKERTNEEGVIRLRFPPLKAF
jgi:hypothetical protein